LIAPFEESRTTTFIPGLQLGRLFYTEAVRPILDAHFPGLAHDAALIGSGSDKLGFDTAMSTDHDWGPSVILFLREEDISLEPQIREVMAYHLPHTFYNYPTNFADSPLEPGTPVATPTTSGPINHRVLVTTVRAFVLQQLGFDLRTSPAPADWLTFPSQVLRTLTSGEIYHHGTGELQAMRDLFHWYPHDVWLYIMAAGWRRISQEEHLMPRAGYVGDELGSSIMGSRLVRDIMSHCFLIERHYAPYPKWFGTAFSMLRCAPELAPLLLTAQHAPSWKEREAALVPAYSYLARAHNALALTDPLSEDATQFFNRPFQVIWGDRFADALLARVTDPAVQQIIARPLIGNIDQLSDNTDLRSNPSLRRRVRRLYT
jgi:hypothetical protein